MHLAPFLFVFVTTWGQKTTLPSAETLAAGFGMKKDGNNMRSRNIKPGICDNVNLGKCSVEARWMFACLPMLTDREGIMEFHPEKIKAKIFPYDEKYAPRTILLWCKELLRFGSDFIAIYEDEGKRYISITNFTKHQHPHINEPKSQLPKFKGVMVNLDTNDVQVPEKHQSTTVLGSLIPDSCILIPDSLKPLPTAPVVKEKIELPYSSEEFSKAWEKWVKYRTTEVKKTKLTPLAIEQQLEFLKEIGEERAIATIYYTIRNSWTGLREPDQSRSLFPSPKPTYADRSSAQREQWAKELMEQQ